jgi:hypothetical protein
MSGRALVLGGGGPVGIAWESGLIAGLAESGIDLSGADFIVGTSAGSVVGAQIAMGRTPAALVEPYMPERARTKKCAERSARGLYRLQLPVKRHTSRVLRACSRVCLEIAGPRANLRVRRSMLSAANLSLGTTIPECRWCARLLRAAPSRELPPRSQSTDGGTWMAGCDRRRTRIWRRGTRLWLWFRSVVRRFRRRSDVHWSAKSWRCTIPAAGLKLSGRMLRALKRLAPI